MAIELDDQTYWQRLFAIANVNSHNYKGEELPALKWDWPRHTWFQKRYAFVKAREAGLEQDA